MMSEDVARQTPRPDAIRVIREALLAPLPANMHIRRDDFGCEIGRSQHAKPNNARRLDQ